MSSKPLGSNPPPSLSSFLAKIKDWFSANFLKLSCGKTEVLLVGTIMTKSDFFFVAIDNSTIFPSSQLSILIHALVSMRIDYSNAFLTGVPSKLLYKL